TCSTSCAASSRSSAPTWPPPSTPPPPARSSTPPRRRSATCSLTSGWPPTRPPCSSASKPRRRLSPPPAHPTTGKALQNKGPEDHPATTATGRVTRTRRRYAAPDVGSCHPLDRWLDQAEDTVSAGLREMACRLNQASRDFDKAAENLGRCAQVRMSGELL